jgi:hypothetical protein
LLLILLKKSNYNYVIEMRNAFQIVARELKGNIALGGPGRIEFKWILNNVWECTAFI